MDEGMAQAIWFADEPVCRLQDAPEWVKRQKKLAKTGAPVTAGCFTLPMLERHCVVGKKISGIAPDADRKVAEENWLCRHPPAKPKTGGEREKLAARMRVLRAIRLGKGGQKTESVQEKTRAGEKKAKSMRQGRASLFFAGGFQ
jgi:hypothetical protein